MKRLTHEITVLLILGAWLGLILAGPAPARAETPVVHAVLFYSPTCPHCAKVIQEILPPLYETYGPQLQIIGVSTLESEGWALYQAAVKQFSIPEERQQVPTLIVGETVLVGTDEIAEQFPDLIGQGLAAGGVALPNIPGLLELLPPEAASASGTGPVIHEDTTSFRERFARDPAGNTLAVIVLAGMIASLGYVVMEGRHAQPPREVAPEPGSSSWGWLVPVLALAGLGVAGYLTYVETLDVRVACGPVGDCNTVQQSEYARLFGVLPIGLLGAIAYLGVLALWAWHRMGSDEYRDALASLLLFGVAVLGTLFSVYLTFLEPFVIGATCAWCLSSAVIITALLLLTARPGLQAARVLLGRPA